MRSARVAPHAGAWIEIARIAGQSYKKKVAPHAGAWIEMITYEECEAIWASHPTRVRGLKYRL